MVYRISENKAVIVVPYRVMKPFGNSLGRQLIKSKTTVMSGAKAIFRGGSFPLQHWPSEDESRWDLRRSTYRLLKPEISLGRTLSIVSRQKIGG